MANKNTTPLHPRLVLVCQSLTAIVLVACGLALAVAVTHRIIGWIW